MNFRKRILDYSEQQVKKMNGELELDESYFGGKRKGNRGREANNKTIVSESSREKTKFILKLLKMFLKKH